MIPRIWYGIFRTKIKKTEATYSIYCAMFDVADKVTQAHCRLKEC